MKIEKHKEWKLNLAELQTDGQSVTPFVINRFPNNFLQQRLSLSLINHADLPLYHHKLVALYKN